MRTAHAVILITIAVISSGCATPAANRQVHIEKTDGSALLLNKAVAKNIVLAQYDAWKGTRYKYGGLSKDGIDCSGFIHQTFLSLFDIRLPRRSIMQGEVGYDISTDLLQPGDLVFFKMGASANHVGIYIDDGEFVHASTSQGVTKSSLNDPYWRRRFWKARRVSL